MRRLAPATAGGTSSKDAPPPLPQDGAPSKLAEDYDEDLAVTEVPWHQLNLDGLQGIAAPFKDVSRGDPNIAKYRSILAGCSRHTLQLEDDTMRGTSKLVRGLSKRLGRSTDTTQIMSLNGNPLAELRTAPFFGNLHEYGVGRAVRLYLRLQLSMSLLFVLIFAASLVAVFDNRARNELRNECRLLLKLDRDSVIHNATHPWYGRCGYDGAEVRKLSSLVPDGSSAFETVMTGPMTWNAGACEEFTNATIFTQPVPSLVTDMAEVFVKIPNSDVCAGEQTLVAYWMQLLIVLLIIGALILLRSHAVALAMRDDKARWTAGDYAVLLRGLRDGLEVPDVGERLEARDLHSALKHDLEAMGFGGEQVLGTPYPLALMRTRTLTLTPD